MDADIKSHIKHSGSSFGGLKCEQQTIWTESVYLLYEIPLHIVLNNRYEKWEQPVLKSRYEKLEQPVLKSRYEKLE